MANVIYVLVLCAVIGYGFYTQRRTARMLQAVLKQTHTDELRWTASQRAALTQATTEEIEKRELDRARKSGPFES